MVMSDDSEMQLGDNEIVGAAEVLLQMHADEISPRQMHADEIYPRQMHADEIYPRQMHADEISPRQMHADDDIAPPQAELEQLQTRLAELDFPNKLYEVVNCTLLDHCIRWNADGTSLQIVNYAAFCKDALNLLCKGNFRSLSRQFQAYGFKKNTKSQCQHEYSHKKGYFRRAQKQKLKRIRRKQAKGKSLQLAEGTDDQWLRVEGRQSILEEEITRLREEVAQLRELVKSHAHAT